MTEKTLLNRLKTLPKRLLLFIIKCYSYAISPLLGSHCRFYPTCSAYVAEAISRFGVIKGCYLGLRRLLRCHPWSEGGVDPVPGCGDSEIHNH